MTKGFHTLHRAQRLGIWFKLKTKQSYSDFASVRFKPIFAELILLALAKTGTPSRAKRDVDKLDNSLSSLMLR